MEKLANAISDWIRDYTKGAGKTSLVVGVSGGVDSAVIAKLCERTGLKVICVAMPISDEEGEVPDSYYRAFNLCVGNKLFLEGDSRYAGMEVEFIKTDLAMMLSNICHSLDTWTNDGPVGDSSSHKLRRGNLAARFRADILYDIAAANNGLVVGTGNLDELTIGYTTKGGDGLVDMEPMAQLHKSDVYRLAEYFEVPREIINIAPSAELWDGQTDEQELGMTYAQLGWAIDYIEGGDASFPYSKLDVHQQAIIRKVRARMKANEHKNALPPVFSLELWKMGQELQ